MNKQSYFLRVQQLSPTQFWINNPTRQQADLAIANGATGCTNNPSYTQKMMDHPLEGAFAGQVLEETLQAVSESDAAAEFQRRMVKPICDRFMPLFTTSGGQKGYVSIQGDPLKEEDPDHIIREALENRKTAPNICCKIPTTETGLKAMEYLFARGVPINATEVFGISQAVRLCDIYTRCCTAAGTAPMLYISHIAGIYDDHLQAMAAKEAIDISPDILFQAGLAVARKLYRLMEERHYPGTFVAGGARGLHHFTEMVGGNVCCTINWEGTADRLLEQDPPVVYRLFNPVPQIVIDELMEKLPDFRRGYLEDGLEVREYEDFGPVRLFRDSFIHSWERVTGFIHEAKQKAIGQDSKQTTES